MLDPGSNFSHYQITGPLGAGGMGEVYRATDKKLKRDVALKVLPPDFASDTERLARFQREAEMLAALNHTNIAQIFGLEQADGITALVMELIEGPTLADRIQQGPLPPDEALNIAMQIAAALEAAHGRGIVHRDLKPANIKLRPDGTVKVLDFGIAKAIEVEGTSHHKSPVMTTPAMTETGLIMGTAAYMSPEQARGKFVDQRTDIWAFGCVLFEMLTGQPAFGGEDVMMTLARVLDRDTDLNSIPGTISPSVRHTIKMCLKKDPKKRVADIRDVRLALAGEFEAFPAQPAAGSVKQTFWRKAVPMAVALAAVVGLAVWFFGNPPLQPQAVNRFVHTAPPDQTLRNAGRNVFALAPDGRRFVYNTTQGLFLRELGELEARLIPGTEETLNNPFFSPDGQSVAYWTQTSQLKRIAISGGGPVVIADNVVSPNGASWQRDDTILLGQPGGIYRVSANGGIPELIMAGEGEILSTPELLPDGDTLLFTAQTSGGIVAQSLSTGVRTELIASGEDAHYLTSGHLTYELGGNLFAVRFDPDSLTVSGSPVPLVQGILTATATASANYAVSANGSLVYVPSASGLSIPAFSLVWVDRTGQESPLPIPERNYGWVRVAPDGTRVVAMIEGDLWVADIARSVLSRITTTDAGETWPLWTPDSQRLVFQISGTLNWTAADGTEATENLLSIDGVSFVSPGDWTSDGKSLLFTYGAGPEDPDIGLLSFADDAEAAPSWRPFLDRDSGASALSMAPDGNRVAYHADDTGQYSVYTERFPELGNRQLVSDADGGWGAIWAADGSELYYRRLGDGAMMAVPVQTTPTFALGTPVMLFAGSYQPLATPEAGGGSPRTWSLAPDGRFLMIKDLRQLNNQSTIAVVVVENWLEELLRLAPGN